MRKAAAGALLLASALCAGSAAAQVTGQVSVTEFSWALVDLDPNDGIDPSLTILPLDGWVPSRASATVNAGGDHLADNNYGSVPLESTSASAGNALGSASASLSGGLNNLTLASAVSLNSNDNGNTLFSLTSSGYVPFVLSPMTAVTFSSRVAMSLGMDVGAEEEGDWVGASAVLDVRTNVDDIGQVWSDSASLATTGGPQSLDTQLSLTVSNALGSETRNSLELYTTVGAIVAAPVPEPGTWAMFLGGLALLLAHARTKASRQQARARG